MNNYLGLGLKWLLYLNEDEDWCEDVDGCKCCLEVGLKFFNVELKICNGILGFFVFVICVIKGFLLLDDKRDLGFIRVFSCFIILYMLGFLVGVFFIYFRVIFRNVFRLCMGVLISIRLSSLKILVIFDLVIIFLNFVMMWFFWLIGGLFVKILSRIILKL